MLDQFTELPASYERALAERRTWRRASTLLRGLLSSPSRVRAERGRSSTVLLRYYLQRPLDLVRRHGANWRTLFTPERFQSGRIATRRWLESHPATSVTDA
jgi:hypothetical protein